MTAMPSSVGQSELRHHSCIMPVASRMSRFGCGSERFGTQSSLVPACRLLARFWTVVLITSANVDMLELEERNPISYFILIIGTVTDTWTVPA